MSSLNLPYRLPFSGLCFCQVRDRYPGATWKGVCARGAGARVACVLYVSYPYCTEYNHTHASQCADSSTSQVGRSEAHPSAHLFTSWARGNGMGR